MPAASIAHHRTRVLQDATREIEALDPTITLEVHLDIPCALQIVAALQLSLRHPGNHGATAETARALIAGLISRMRAAGAPATAALAELGDDPDYDDQVGPTTAPKR